MHRDHIPADGGMLFSYPSPRPLHFWMKNCLVDMDLIFLDASGTVVANHRMTIEPARGNQENESDYHNRLKRYSSGDPAQFAIELQAGQVQRLGLKPGDRIALPDEARITR